MAAPGMYPYEPSPLAAPIGEAMASHRPGTGTYAVPATAAPTATNAKLSSHPPVASSGAALPTSAPAAAVAAPPPPPVPEQKPGDGQPKPNPNSPKNFPPPPEVLHDRKQKQTYARLGLLGEGGFARCYEIVNPAGKHMAAKVISKASLKTQKARSKLVAEVRIHQGLNHPGVVRYHHAFEDDANVYIVLELCTNRTFVDLLKKRKRLNELEVRFWMWQLLAGVKYLHDNHIIHRDLKLGNLFLTEDLSMRIGDFGLAASIKHDGERKKTICGTPNYIAPEVLFDTQNGHSYEVDIWSLGVIMYTMLIGRPPFQTKIVKAIYKKIKENSYEFPPQITLSPEARGMITSLLHSKPECRPNIASLFRHPFFTNEPIPKTMPLAVLSRPITVDEIEPMVLPPPPPLPTPAASVATAAEPGPGDLAEGTTPKHTLVAAANPDDVAAVYDRGAHPYPHAVAAAPPPPAAHAVTGIAPSSHRLTRDLTPAAIVASGLDARYQTLVGRKRTSVEGTLAKIHQREQLMGRSHASGGGVDAAAAAGGDADPTPPLSAAPPLSGSDRPGLPEMWIKHRAELAAPTHPPLAAVGKTASSPAASRGLEADLASAAKPVLLSRATTGSVAATGSTAAAAAAARRDGSSDKGSFDTGSSGSGHSQRQDAARRGFPPGPHDAVTDEAAAAALKGSVPAGGSAPSAASLASSAMDRIRNFVHGHTGAASTASAAAAAAAAAPTTAPSAISTAALVAPVTTINAVEAAGPGYDHATAAGAPTHRLSVGVRSPLSRPGTGVHSSGTLSSGSNHGPYGQAEPALSSPTPKTIDGAAPGHYRTSHHHSGSGGGSGNGSGSGSGSGKASRVVHSTPPTNGKLSSKKPATDGAAAPADSLPGTPGGSGSIGLLEQMHTVLDEGLAAQKKGALPRFALNPIMARHPSRAADTPGNFITKWIDYSNKYGLGYQLRNGSTGVYFNDSTTITLAANNHNFEYLFYETQPSSQRAVLVRQSHTLTHFPPELQKKVTLLKHFQSYMYENLYRACDPADDASESSAATTRLDFLTKYLRTKQGVIFRLSNQVLQLNLFDHTKVVLGDGARCVTYVDKNRTLRTQPLIAFLEEGDPAVLERLAYARDVIYQMLIKKRQRAATAIAA